MTKSQTEGKKDINWFIERHKENLTVQMIEELVSLEEDGRKIKKYDEDSQIPVGYLSLIFSPKRQDLRKKLELLLTQQRTELLEEIKDEIKKSMPVVPIEYKDGWDRCIDYVEQIIEDEIHFTDL